jgi:hypothetical protein
MGVCMVEGMGMKVWGEGSAVQSGEIYRRNIAGGSEWASRNATQRNASGWIDGWHVYVNAMLCDAMPCYVGFISTLSALE